MKTKAFLIPALFLMGMLATSVSCSKSVTDEAITNIETTDGNSTLNIVTRSGDNDAKLSYPVVLYLFNGTGQCLATQTLNSSEDAISFQNLRAGTYSVYAIGGADDSRYTIPTQTNATTTALVSLQEGKTHEDLMAGHNTVVIGDDETNQLTLALSRKVCQLRTIQVKQVPDDIDAVAIAITPIREALLLNGDYSGETGIFTLSLNRQGDGRTWENAIPQYMLPSVGNATISIKMTKGTTTKSYSYTCAEPLAANYIIDILATYTGSTFNMTGTLTGATWAGERTITFEFDETNSTGSETSGNNDEPNDPNNDNPGDDTPGEVINGQAPAEGTSYQGAYVLKSDVNADNTSTVTLMAAKHVKDLTIPNDPEAATATINNAIASLAIDGISGWRLPTTDELDYLTEYCETINENLIALYTQAACNTFSTNGYYFIYLANQTLSSYRSSGKNQSTKYNTDFTNATIVRAVTTLTFKNE